MLNAPLDVKIDNLIGSIKSQFNNRAVVENTKKGILPNVYLNTEVKDNTLWLHFSEKQTLSIDIPLPFIKNGITFVKKNEVVRTVCNYWMEKEQLELDYTAIMYNIVCAGAKGLVPDNLTKGYPFLQQMIFAFENSNPAITAYRFQRAINEIINRMPLYTTDLNGWVMNRRLIIIDEEFEEIRSPKECLKYQVNKARKYFDRGWTSIGLSDGALATKNYILTKDLRALSPFGQRYHNPQRNLYSTLGMEGDELPIIRSRSMQDLMDQGINRTGWNFFTLFADVPDIFEDQIIVDTSHKDKFVTHTKRYQIFGKLFVKVGDKIKVGSKLGVSPDDEVNLFTVHCDSAKIKSVSKSTTNVGGEETPIHNVIVEYKQKFKDGLKLTNVHGNKGVIRLRDLGYAIDPRTNRERKIDIIVGAKTIGKRKNYGQIIEALMNCLIEPEDWKMPESPIVLQDDWSIPIDTIKTMLSTRGFNKDGTWICHTPYGKLYGICGRIFWGCINTPEHQIWDSGATTVRDNKEIRKAGLKFSHVELMALKTRFGDSNPVIDEIMSYAQGSENLKELFDMINSKLGVLPKDKMVRDITNTRPLDQVNSTIVPGQYINGTVVDEYFMPDGFIFKLPLQYQTLLGKDDEVLYEGFPKTREQMDPSLLEKIVTPHLIDAIYIPSGLMRKCWRHDSGKYGLNDIGTIINNVITMSSRLHQDPLNVSIRGLYYLNLHNFFKRLSAIIGTKRGQLSACGMSVRYPFSVKGVATLSTTLPKNTIEIHRTMAEQLDVKNGDVSIVVRFPCLGFMSVRLQKIHITDDIMCKYTIRASGNSLVSQNLDFDGDTLFVASFHTPEAKSILSKEWANPNRTCYREITRLNERKGAPHIEGYTLDKYKIKTFTDLTNKEHADIVEKNTGVKAQTGPIIALTYNIMRMVENSNIGKHRKSKVGIGVFLEKAAQSVFEQKHGGESLHEVVIRSICTGDVESLVKEEFNRGVTTMLVDLVKQKAAMLGITDLIKYHKQSEEKGISNIISLIVRKQNRIYFASRSILESASLIRAINEPAVDVPSEMFKWVMSGRTLTTNTKLEDLKLFKALKTFNTDGYKKACISLIREVFNQKASKKIFSTKQTFGTGEYGNAETVGHRR